jgi:hypothetical protein
MSLLGVHLTLLIGPTVPIPAPLPLTEALNEVKVTQSDSGRSGFEITFTAGRGGITGVVDYPLLSLPLLEPFNRVILVVTLGVIPQVLMDGIITRREVSPGAEPGQGRITITGEDVSVMMDLHEKSQQYPAMDETLISDLILVQYAQYGLIPEVIPPIALDLPLPVERIPVQQGTDLDYLNKMAARFGYVFYIIPGPLPFTNTAYWGPKLRPGVPQSAITINMGGETNATIGAFQTNALGPQTVGGLVQDRDTGVTVPVQTFASTEVPLSLMPVGLVNILNTRSSQFRESGVNIEEAFGRAQGTTDATAHAVSVDGELDAATYGSILQPRGLVGLRGAGFLHDGLWYVKKVSHHIKIGTYTQSFTLTRDGHGSTVPAVIP